MLGKRKRSVEIFKRHFHFRKQVATPGILGMGFDLRLKNGASSLPVACLDKRFHVRALALGGRTAGKTLPGEQRPQDYGCQNGSGNLRDIVARYFKSDARKLKNPV